MQETMQEVLEKFNKFYSNPKNKERLLRLIKTNGKFIKFVEQQGFLYSVKIGESKGYEIILDVILNRGNITIKNVKKEKSQNDESENSIQS
jgi:hypothetical protein